MKLVLTAVVLGLGFSLACLGCGSGSTVVAMFSPSISQLSPQVVTAGTPGVTVTVKGSNFDSTSAVVVNGAAVPTSVVSSDTLTAKIGSTALAQPAVAPVLVRNFGGISSNAVNLTVQSAQKSQVLSISTTSLAAAVVGSPYSSTLSASGGTSSYTWTVAGSLPAGMSLSSAGVLSGTPLAVGTTTFTVQVKDSSSPAQTQSVQLTLVVAPAVSTGSPLSVGSVVFAPGQVGASYSATVSASGGTPGYSWAVTSGNLPAGLTVSSTGAISGTPTASGTSNFTLTVNDSGSPAQSKSMSGSISVASAKLTISSGGLPGGKAGSSYSATLSASGGTAGYTWSIAPGSLPAGLTLSSSGVISGTPTASGQTSFTVTATDSSSPAQTATAAESITIASSAPALTITSSTLSSAQVGVAYSSTLQATGGTGSYTWTVAGSLPAGLNVAATGAITGTPTASGNASFTVQVADSGSPVQTQSATVSLVIVAAQGSAGPGTTWYVRKDGGTRYSTNMLLGQCDGKGDGPYPGSGVNQHCAFNDIRSMYGDGSYNDGVDFPGFGWVMKGGDTLIIRGSIATGVSYRIGWDNMGFAYNCQGANPITGKCGDPYSSSVPPPPAGTATQHTRILGENYASCKAPSAKTQLHGGAGVFDVLDLSGASYVDVACLDITDFSACDNCTTSDDSSTNGLAFTNTTTNTTVTDVHIHGMAGNGIYGPPGDGVVMDYVDVIGNHSAGWEADNGTAGVGHVKMSHFNILWNGCVEEYPIVDPLPYKYCRDDDHGGYGDGFGSATLPSPAPGWQVTFDQGTVAYNTQDGLDGLHILGPGSSMTVNRVMAYGNMGQQLKIGAIPTVTNSVIVGNCGALLSMPGTPAGFNTNLDDYCRAGDTAVVLMISPTNPVVFQDNTMYSDGLVGFEVEYFSTPTGTETAKFNNNIFVGFLNYNHVYPSPIYSNTDLNMFTNPGASFSNNLTYHGKYGLPCPLPGETASLCTDPGLVDETYYPGGIGNMAPLSTGNAVQGAGVAIPGITTDYTGKPRGNPPSIGAYE